MFTSIAMSNPTPNLNDNHRNTLLAGLKYMDRLLAEGFAGLAPANEGAVFAPMIPDATPMQRKVIADLVAQVRRTMRATLEACEIPIRPPTLGALWSLRSALTAVQIAVEELGPSYLSGYGALDEETVASVSVLQAQLRASLNELQKYLDDGRGGLAERLARLDQTTDEGRLLRELELIITRHGIVEFRPSLEQLLGRFEKNWWTIAFLGRVSCGKSSLLNHLLATDVLPAGVTPVTAVPIRIVAGASPSATVAFATRKRERVAAAQLCEFASEERNPGNARHVTDILLELPSPRLADDVCFVDTPGLGSLATAGAVQTLAFLPRCDVGVLLLDAATSLNEDDLAVAHALLENGAEVLAVVSKADLLSPADREKIRAYTARQLATALGCEVAVALVSVAAADADLTEAWWKETLAPRQAHHRDLAAATLRRKAGALREAVAAALAHRAGKTAPPPASPEISASIGAVRAALENADRKAYDLAFQATQSAAAVLDSAAPALADLARHSDLAAAFAGELGRSAARLAGQFELLLNEVRTMAEHALAVVRESSELAELSRPDSRPLFDPAPVIAACRLSTAWRRWPTAATRRAALRRHLRAHFAEALDDALRNYGHALVGWSHHYLGDLTAQFNAQAWSVEARAVSPASIQNAPSPELARDLALLRDWNSRGAL